MIQAEISGHQDYKVNSHNHQADGDSDYRPFSHTVRLFYRLKIQFLKTRGGMMVVSRLIKMSAEYVL